MNYILDENNNVKLVSLMEWAMWFSDNEKRRVGLDIIGRFRVSTVFMGTDYNFGDVSSGPLVFETMIFDELDVDENGDQRGHDLYCRRYGTYAEAEYCHNKIVEYLTENPSVTHYGINQMLLETGPSDAQDSQQ